MPRKGDEFKDAEGSSATHTCSEEEIELQILIAKRNSLFARLQNIFDLSKDVSISIEQRNLFLSSASNIDQLRNEFEKILYSCNMINLKLNSKYQVDYQPWTSFEDLYCRIKHLSSTISSTEQSTSATQHDYFSRSFSQLPPIELKSFNGDIRQWPLFYQQFKSIIHDNPRLTDAERIYYLIGKLTDKALSVCAGLAPTPENYTLIWNALIHRYDDTRALSATYINQLLELKPVNANTTVGYHTFIDKFDSAIKALKQLNIDDLTDFLFLNLALKKLDSETVKSFEMSCRKEKIPKYASLIQFLHEQSRALRHSSNFNQSNVNVTKARDNKNIPTTSRGTTKTFVNTDKSKLCIMCSTSNHEHLYNCPQFLQLTPQDRYNFVKQNGLCTNCLSNMHKVFTCKSQRNCSQCSYRHNSLLHFISNRSNLKNTPNDEQNQQCIVNSPQSSKGAQTNSNSNSTPTSISNKIKVPQYNSVEQKNDTSTVSSCNVSRENLVCKQTTTLLATVKIKIIDRFGREHFARCLLDSGSQSDYITQKCCKRLSLPISGKNRYTEVHGIGGTSQSILGVTSVQFTSRFDNNKIYNIKPLVISHITGMLPDSRVNTDCINHFSNLPLADDQFYEPGEIDILLGVNLYCQILLSEKIIKDDFPTALETTLGYVIMGDIDISAPRHSSSFCAVNQKPLNEILENFWKIEELPAQHFLSPDEKQCEDIYTSTTTRDPEGHYVVALPFKDSPIKLGNSLKGAQKRYALLEKRFLRHPDLRKNYNDVIRDYIDKGFLSLVTPDNLSEPCFYLPHHPVIRNDKTTTKLRVVIDGSAKTDTELSLNDILHIGQNLQSDIFNILLNIRVFRIAFFADIRQMYLCIIVQNSDRKYQRILYRFSPDEEIKIYEFTRVTFGLRSSPFLALRTVRQLANDERDNFPLAAPLVERDIYMDDLASSVSSDDEAVLTATQLINMFKRGGFDLVKWNSNSSELLKNIPASHRQQESVCFDVDDTFKILGLRWHPATDNFDFVISPPSSVCTKRAILSATARLYDVLGLVGPVTLFSKLLIKELWLLKLDWDDIPPDNIINLWQQYINQLPLLSRLQFPRHVGIEKDSRVSLVAFADASEKAYGCVIYLHVTNDKQSPIVTLVCSKSRVAPVKTVTLARLELCALVLLSKLVRIVYDTLSARHIIDGIYAFSDSEVALCWVCSSPHRFNTFVANRISQCQSLLSSDNFYHIAGCENPADCVSRGLLPSRLLEHELWFHGPSWISSPRNEWPISKFSPNSSSLPEQKTVSHSVCDPSDHPLLNLSLKFSSWNKFLHAVVYFLRFIKKLPRNNIITATDLDVAEHAVIKALQQSHFAEDIKNLKKGNVCSPILRKLTPFLSEDLLHVGGRLDNSSLTETQKHPLVLPRNGHIIELIINHYHRVNFHAGPQLLLSILRQKFWMLQSARRIVRAAKVKLKSGTLQRPVVRLCPLPTQ